MRQIYKFGVMLERIDGWWKYEFAPSEFDQNRPMWRVFSARLHGPVMFTRRSAFFAWLKHWLIDFVRTNRRR